MITDKQIQLLTDNLITISERISVLVKENEMLKKENEFLKELILKYK